MRQREPASWDAGSRRQQWGHLWGAAFPWLPACVRSLLPSRCRAQAPAKRLRCAKLQGKGGVYGAGDLLFSFLGVVIICFSFKIYEQWVSRQRRAPWARGAWQPPPAAACQEICGRTDAAATSGGLCQSSLHATACVPAHGRQVPTPRKYPSALTLQALMKRHAPEILGSTAASAAFSMISTALLARLVQLPPGEALAPGGGSLRVH